MEIAKNMNSGQKLYKKAKKLIPGGTMLLSKRPEMFLPNRWPSYFSKAKSCEVWDLDGNKYIDVSIMGIGTNILGYGHPKVDKAVLNTIKQGNMSTLNCPEEVYLAERLIKINPWADMVRLARTGGEANSIAIRIARAASGKDKVAICGYHGWHDWYLSTNLRNKSNLDTHLLSGLEPTGVPTSLTGTTIPFSYNNFEELNYIVENNDIGVIKMEVLRNIEPKNDFLQKVRDLATKKGIVLIFDECTSGFRETFGGIYKKYGVEPDVAVYGKTLGNGYAITAVVGKQAIMDCAQKTFISSTFWTERIGPSAALATLKVMEKEKSWKKITKIGENVTLNWHKIAKDNKLEIVTLGIPALSVFSFKSKDTLKYKTYITQEMLKKGYLAGNSLYASICHTDEILEKYYNHLYDVFKAIYKCENGELNIDKLLDGPVCHSGFERLN